MAPRASRASGANTDTDTSMVDAPEPATQLQVDPMVCNIPLACFGPSTVAHCALL
jgi:hypothetical protein